MSSNVIFTDDKLRIEFTNQKFHLNENEAELLSGLLDKLRG
jgi:hypothetical protein